MLWQALIARIGGIHLAWPPVAVLGLSVWLAYAADRWIEGWRLDPQSIRTPRHYFYHRYRWPVAVVWMAALVADVAIAFTRLSSFHLVAGFVLLAAVAAYLLSHQFVHRDRPWRLPKEVCVAILLTAGVAVFLIQSPRLSDVMTPLAWFALLCFANCSLISVWERHVDRAHGQTSLVVHSSANTRAIRRLPWVIVMLAGLALAVDSGAATRVATGCAGASALLLAAIDGAEAHTGRQLARVLADLALMTPAAALFWP